MYTLLVVDDEDIVLKAISHVVKEYCPQVKVVGQTGSGSEAVALALAKKPDFVFMDIEISGCNGLEAIEEIKKALPETIIMVISAYDNFYYAKKSMELGVMDYLLKPVTRDDIVAILNKARNTLEEQRQKIKEQLRIKEKFHKVMPFLEEKLFLSLLYSRAETTHWDDYKQFLEVDIAHSYAIAVLVDDKTFCLPKIQDNLKESLRNLLKKKGIKLVLFSPPVGRMLLVLLGEGEEIPERLEFWKKVYTELHSALKLPLSIILGPVHPGFEGMIRSFKELRFCLQVYSCPPGVYYWTEAGEIPKKAGDFPWRIEQELFAAVRSGQTSMAELVFADLFRIVTHAPDVKFEACKEYFYGLGAVILRIGLEKFSGKPEHPAEGNHYLSLVNRAGDFGELKLVMREMLQFVTKKLPQKIFWEKYPEIYAAGQYMEKNYAKDISLHDIAAAASVSTGYLSRLFKEHCGQTVIETLQKTRLENDFATTAGKRLYSWSYRVKRTQGNNQS